MKNYRELAGRNRDAFLPNLARSLHNLATLQSEVGKQDEALATGEEAVQMRRELAGRNRDAFLPDLAMSLNNLATLQSAVRKWEEALGTAEEAVKMRRELAGRNRHAFLPDLATSLGALSSVHAAREEYDRAHVFLKEALQLIVPMYEGLPAAFEKLTLLLTKDYLAACEQSSQAPDAALLNRIAAKRPPQ